LQCFAFPSRTLFPTFHLQKVFTILAVWFYKRLVFNKQQTQHGHDNVEAGSDRGQYDKGRKSFSSQLPFLCFVSKVNKDAGTNFDLLKGLIPIK